MYMRYQKNLVETMYFYYASILYLHNSVCSIRHSLSLCKSQSACANIILYILLYWYATDFTHCADPFIIVNTSGIFTTIFSIYSYLHTRICIPIYVEAIYKINFHLVYTATSKHVFIQNIIFSKLQCIEIGNSMRIITVNFEHKSL